MAGSISGEADLAAWLTTTLGAAPRDLARYRRALTHASREEPDYERLEFLGDRVLGLCVAEWLYEAFPDEPEGALSKRLNALVSGATCAAVARQAGAGAHLRLGKQAEADGAGESEHVLGDVMESLLGALYLEAGFEAARAWVRRRWASRVADSDTARKHPKAELQEWALARNLGLPVYTSVGETGPEHLPSHTVALRVGPNASEATASTKREAETEAARTLLTTMKAAEATKRRKRRKVRTHA